MVNSAYVLLGMLGPDVLQESNHTRTCNEYLEGVRLCTEPVEHI